MLKKRILVFALLVSLLIFSLSLFALIGSSAADSTGCCVSADQGCVDLTTQGQCPSPGVFNLGKSCGVISDCEVGCCLTFLSSNKVDTIDCDPFRNKIACVSQPPVTDQAFFDSSYTEQECYDVCLLGDIFGDISGTVFFSTQDMPAQNAAVEVLGYKVFTDENGQYSVSNVPKGNRTVKASYAGYVSVMDYADVKPSEVTALDIYLRTPVAVGQGAVRGTVKDNLGTAVSGASVTCSNKQGTTDFTGQYELLGVTPGTFICSASKAGYQDGSKEITLNPDETKEGVDIALTLITGVCGNNKVETGEECDGSAAPNQCSTRPGCTAGCRCPLSCTDAGGVCVTYEYQCPISHASDAFRIYDGSCGNMKCCGSTQITPIPQCAEDIKTTSVAGSGGSMCNCGGVYYDVTVATSFCCKNMYGNYYYSPNPCAMGRIYGYVYDESNSPKSGAKVEAFKSGVSQASATADSSGYYTFDTLPTGTYILKATMSGYQESIIENIVLAKDEAVRYDFYILPFVSKCELYIPAPSLVVSNVKGVASMNLTWSQDCVGSILGFWLWRDDKFVTYLSPDTRIFLDDGADIGGLVWDKWYHYELGVVLTKPSSITSSASQLYQTVSTIVNTTKKDKYSGNHSCEGIYHGNNFCVDSSYLGGTPLTIIAKCDQNNIISAVENCRVLQRPTGLCLGPDSDGNVACASPSDCPSVGGTSNVFGMYYQRSTCEFSTVSNKQVQNFCYYDYSATNVDKCLNCKENGICYDYEGKSACESDNCLYGNTRGYGCKWQDNYYGDLGKGICYVEGYEGTDFCGLCSPTNPIFENVACTDDVCDVLGNCFSTAYQESCAACTSQTRCEDFGSQNSCGEMVMDKNNPLNCQSSYEIEASADACGLGVCSWLNGVCIKDGDDDGVSDCSESDYTCQHDTSPPLTYVSSKKMTINKIGGYVVFAVNEPSETYYCIDQSLDGVGCCPNIRAWPGLNTSIPQNNIGLDDYEGMVYLRYYSIDEKKNVESIKTESLNIDRKSPQINVTYTITDGEAAGLESNLGIDISSSEVILCSYNFTGHPISAHKGAIGIEASGRIDFVDLIDGRYSFKLSCMDFFQNPVTVEQIVYIDRYHNIYDEMPNSTLKTSLTNTIDLGLRTIKSGYCSYNSSFYNPSGIMEQFNDPVVEPNSYYHKKQISWHFASGTYNIEVACYAEKTRQTLLDVSNIIFTIDNTPPTIIVQQDIDGISYPIGSDAYYGNPKVSIRCEDDDYDYPGEFGCNSSSIRYCADVFQCQSVTVYAAPGNFLSGKSTGTYFVCAKASDKGGNENSNCQMIRIDKDAPQLLLSKPANNQVFGDNESVIDVIGTFYDPAGVEVNVDWFTKTESSNRNAAVSGTGYQTRIELFDGANTVRINAKDLLVDSSNANKNNISVTVYKDVYEPNLTSPVIYNHNSSRIDSSCTQKCADGELFNSITFMVTAKDLLYTNSVSEVRVIVDGDSFSRTLYLTKIGSSDNFSYTLVPAYQDYIPVGDYIATYIAKDRYGNQKVLRQAFSILDTQAPKLNITIDDCTMKQCTGAICKNSLGEVKVSAYFNCSVTVQSSEPVATLDLKYGLVNGSTKITMQNAFVDSERRVYKYPNSLFIPSVDEFRSKYGLSNAEFTVSVKDDSGNQGGSTNILAGKYFEIDTFAPDIRIIKPDGSVVGSEKVNLVGRTYRSPLSAGVYVSDQPVYIEHYAVADDGSVVLKRRYDPVSTTSSSNLLGSTNMTVQSAKGSFLLELWDTSGSLAAIITEGTYIAVANHDRSRLNYYAVKRSEYNYALFRTTVELKDPLESSVPIATAIKVYDKSAPIGWFELPQDITLSAGKNSIRLFSKDEVNNYGKDSFVNMTLDVDSFIIINKMPDDGTVTGDAQLDIKVFIEDESSDIDMQSLNLQVLGNGLSLNATCLTSITNILECLSGKNRLNLTFSHLNLPSGSYPEGMINVTLSGKDKAGNQKVEKWSFTIDTAAPLTPSMTVTPGSQYDFIWYSNDSAPVFRISFQEPVNLPTVELAENASVTFSCQTISGSEYQCAPNVPMADKRYHLIVESYRLSADHKGRWIFPVIIDTVAPSVTVSAPSNVMNVSVAALAKVTDSNLRDFTVSGDITSSFVIPGSSYQDAYPFNVTLTAGPEGNRNIIITAYDKAGNSFSSTGAVYYDSLIDFVDWSPKLYTNSIRPTISVEVDRSAACAFTGVENKLMFQSGRDGDNFIYSATLATPLNESTLYSFVVTCDPDLPDQSNGSMVLGFTVYTTPPGLNITQPVPNSNYTQSVIKVVGIASTNTPGVFIKEILVNSKGMLPSKMPVVSGQSFSVPIILRNGSNTVRVIAVDVAGNEKTVDINNVYYLGHGPSVVWIDPANGTVNQKVTKIRARIKDDDNSGLQLSSTQFNVSLIGEGAVTYLSGTVTSEGNDIAVFTPAGGEIAQKGVYSVIVMPKDNYYYGKAAQSVFTIDADAPYITADQPPYKVRSSNVPFTGSITSATNISSTSLIVGGVDRGSLNLNSAGAYQTSVALQDGFYIYSVYALNTAGKHSIYNRPFELDTILPNVTIVIS